MMNVVAAQQEIEYRRQRLIDEAEEYRRTKLARAGASGTTVRARRGWSLAGITQRHRRNGAGGSSAPAA